jgi:hypothetical protein
MSTKFSIYDTQIIIKTNNATLCHSPDEILHTDIFKHCLENYIKFLKKNDSPLLEVFPEKILTSISCIVNLLQLLLQYPKEIVVDENPQYKPCFDNVYLFAQFIEQLYNYWRNFERFLIIYSDHRLLDPHHKRPYRTFNDTIDKINHYVRRLYRDIVENIVDDHPRIYRQTAAGFQVGFIASTIKSTLQDSVYKKLHDIPFINHILIEPPLIIDPPMNKRTGRFEEVSSNPLTHIHLKPTDFICYPAQVGNLIIHVYFHHKFIGLGSALANLFELVPEEKLKSTKPDAVYVYGASRKDLKIYGDFPIVYYTDTKEKILVGAVPDDSIFAYFGYLKKMILTLHNVIQIRRGNLPVHGAMVNIQLKNNKSGNVLIIGDSGAGKSESLEAFRQLSSDYLRQMTVIFDDMGSLAIKDNKIKAYGTEIGAFVRLDDLQPGFAFGNIDRSIIMSPQKINARAVMPITPLEEIQKGYSVDYVLYANNYEQIDETHSALERSPTVDEALDIFREGARMAKGTTSEEGITHSFYANPFGAPQCHDEYEKLAREFFTLLFKQKIYVGQLRTRLGISGYEQEGPLQAAKALFKCLEN